MIAGAAAVDRRRDLHARVLVAVDDRQVIVIGSGPPGATAAHFLARAGIATTVLEAGSENSDLGLTVRVKGIAVVRWSRRQLLRRNDAVSFSGSPDTELFEELAPGGLSNHWSCAVPRFSEHDFRDAERAGERQTWPVRYADLAPWYDQVEPLLSIAGGAADHAQVPAGRVGRIWELWPDWEPLAARAHEQGRDILPLPYTYGGATTVTVGGNVFNAFVRLVRPLWKAGRVRVKFDARALRLEWSRDKRAVTAVIYRDMKTGRDERIPCGAVVVAAGAINSARILLESTSDEFPAGLGNTEGVLGAYLHDHPLAKLVLDLGTAVPIHPPLYISRPALERTEPLYAGAGAQWSGTPLVVKSLLTRGRRRDTGFSIFGTMAPSPENRVSLDGTRRSDGTAGMVIAIRHPPESQRLLEQTRDQFVELFSQAGLAPQVRVFKVEVAGNANHYGGTVRMHRSARYGMLDGWSRMHAARNVVVADSSAFTTGPEKNPVLTSMTLAARGADRLARDLRTGSL
jgi:choline dehydrogenase-like flavoprotein